MGAAAAVWYAQAGLTLSHYDAKAHLVVARRILDSLTPGWEQIGAVWLPLPHLLNMLPVQIDVLYRTGLFAVAVSVLCHGVATWSVAAVVLSVTRSRAASVLAGALFAANPNLLYLQSTPMTEPLLFAWTLQLVREMTRGILSGTLHVSRTSGWLMVLACLTRYEAWPVVAMALVASGFAWWRLGHALASVIDIHARLAAYPAAAILGFMTFSRITVGEWFVSSGFFVPDATLQGQPEVVLQKIIEGTVSLGGIWLTTVGLVAAISLAVAGLVSRGRSPLLVPLSLFGAAALPAAAYLSGHPFRVRYQVALVVACALATGLGVGLLRRAAPGLALVIVGLVVRDVPPFDRTAQMVREAQLDPNVGGRRAVSACLAERYDGGTIMASMSALGHYMHELSQAGFGVRDFLHEGNGPMWDSAFTRGPAALAKWVLVEEAAEGGDAIAQRRRQLPNLLAGFSPVCSGGNVTLYRRTR